MRWKDSEVVVLQALYNKNSYTEIGTLLGKNQRTVSDKAKGLGLRKTRDEINKIISESKTKYFEKIGKSWNRKKKSGFYSVRKRRIRALRKFGGKCILCMMDDFEVLQFDHKNNDGYKYSESILIQVEKYPERFQILCANCNVKKEGYRREFERLERLNASPF